MDWVGRYKPAQEPFQTFIQYHLVIRLRFDKTSSLSFWSWGRRALASDQSQAIKLVNISQLVHFSNTIRCPLYIPLVTTMEIIQERKFCSKQTIQILLYADKELTNSQVLPLSWLSKSSRQVVIFIYNKELTN